MSSEKIGQDRPRPAMTTAGQDAARLVEAGRVEARP